MTQRLRSSSDQTLPATIPASPSQTSALQNQPHELECLIQRSLQTHAGLKFSRLTVHQFAQGVCLEGLLESNEQGIDLCDLVNEIAGVSAINRVVMRTSIAK